MPEAKGTGRGVLKVSMGFSFRSSEVKRDGPPEIPFPAQPTGGRPITEIGQCTSWKIWRRALQLVSVFQTLELPPKSCKKTMLWRLVMLIRERLAYRTLRLDFITAWFNVTVAVSSPFTDGILLYFAEQVVFLLPLLQCISDRYDRGARQARRRLLTHCSAIYQEVGIGEFLIRL